MTYKKNLERGDLVSYPSIIRVPAYGLAGVEGLSSVRSGEISINSLDGKTCIEARAPEELKTLTLENIPQEVCKLREVVGQLEMTINLLNKYSEAKK